MSAIIPWNDPGGSPCCCTICIDNGLRNIPIDSLPRPYHYKRIDGATYEAIRQNGFEFHYEFDIDGTRGTLASAPFSLTSAIPYNGGCFATFSDTRSVFVTSSNPQAFQKFVNINVGFFIGIQDSTNIKVGQENLKTWANKEIEPAPSTNSPILYFVGFTGQPNELLRASVPVSYGSTSFELVIITTGGSTSHATGASLTFLGDPIAATFSNNFTGVSVNIDISIAAP